MNAKEKAERKASIAEHINLDNARLKDTELELLENLVKNRIKLDGKSKTYTSSHKSFDSDGTQYVDETRTYTFRAGTPKIHIDEFFKSVWDNKTNENHYTHDSARDILNLLKKIF